MNDDPRIPSKADVKAELAALGVSLHPDSVLTTVTPPQPGTPVAIIVLDRVADVPRPEYCTHGHAQCIQCYHFCWLGDSTLEHVTSGRAYPTCLPCATAMAADQGLTPADAEHVRDTRRDEGHR